MIDTQPPQPGENKSESSRLTGTTSNPSLIGTQQEHGHQLVHRDGANAATNNMTQDAHFKIVSTTRRSKNKKQHAVGSEYVHNEGFSHQFTI